MDRSQAGRKGGYARAKKLSKKRQSEIARKAVNARWAKVRAERQELERLRKIIRVDKRDWGEVLESEGAK
jgi:hypothetical protein